jgi:hypothetical protein
MSALVDRASSRFIDAARLVGFDLKAYPNLHDINKMRLDLAPLRPLWPIICKRYVEEVYDGQRDLFSPEVGADELFSRFIHWELWPGLVADNENLRNILRTVGLLPCGDPLKAAQALELALEEYPESDHIYKMRLGLKV